jgi:HAD superfamily hydrolase (TIGR01509 family)
MQGAIFDLDGTLLDSMEAWKEIDIRFLEKRGISATTDYSQAVAQLGFRAAAEYTAKRYHLDEKPDDIITEWNQMASHAYAREIGLKPNAREYLQYLTDHGIPLGIATALHHETIEAALKNNGIYHLFDSFTTLQEVSRGKGFPDIYLLAAQKMGLESCECVVFEDILSGVKGAKAGGFRVCGVFDASSEHEWDLIREVCDMTILDFAELLE